MGRNDVVFHQSTRLKGAATLGSLEVKRAPEEGHTLIGRPLARGRWRRHLGPMSARERRPAKPRVNRGRVRRCSAECGRQRSLEAARPAVWLLPADQFGRQLSFLGHCRRRRPRPPARAFSVSIWRLAAALPSAPFTPAHAVGPPSRDPAFVGVSNSNSSSFVEMGKSEARQAAVTGKSSTKFLTPTVRYRPLRRRRGRHQPTARRCTNGKSAVATTAETLQSSYRFSRHPSLQTNMAAARFSTVRRAALCCRCCWPFLCGQLINQSKVAVSACRLRQ